MTRTAWRVSDGRACFPLSADSDTEVIHSEVPESNQGEADTHLLLHCAHATREHHRAVMMTLLGQRRFLHHWQMRWCPSVIRWCLIEYRKSHRTYEQMHTAGFLCLSSG